MEIQFFTRSFTVYDFATGPDLRLVPARNSAWVHLGHYEMIDVEQFRESLHWQIIFYGSIAPLCPCGKYGISWPSMDFALNSTARKFPVRRSLRARHSIGIHGGM